MRIDVPGYGLCDIENLVLDYNGTLALQGVLIEGVKERIKELSRDVKIYIVTADTFGTVKDHVESLPVNLVIIDKKKESESKFNVVRTLGEEKTIAIGNGSNDESMLKAARMGLCVCQQEGCSVKAIMSADAMYTSILDALDSIINDEKLIATLRF